MQVNVNIPFDVSKTTMDFGDLMFEVLKKYEDLEDLMLVKIAKKSDKGDYASKKDLFKSLSK